MKIRNVFVHGSGLFVIGILLIIAIVVIQIISINQRLEERVSEYRENLRRVTAVTELAAMQLGEFRTFRNGYSMSARVKIYELNELIGTRYSELEDQSVAAAAVNLGEARNLYRAMFDLITDTLDSQSISPAGWQSVISQVENLQIQMSDRLFRVNDAFLNLIQDTTQSYRQLFIAVLIIFSVYLVLMVGYSIFVAYFAESRVVKPLDTLIASAEAVAAGNYIKCGDVRASTEVGATIDAFNDMVDRLQDNNREIVEKNRQLQVMSDEISTLNLNLEEKVEQRSRELMLTQDYLRQILYSAPVSIAIFNQDFMLMDCNIRFMNIYGVMNKSSLLKSSDASVVKELGWQDHIVESMQSGNHRTKPMLHNQKWYIHNFCPLALQDDQVDEVMVFSEDVTEIVRANERVALKNQELEEFVYTVSHDLKSPLFSLRGFISILEERLGDSSDPQLGRLLGSISSGIRNVERRIVDLLQLSRVATTREEEEDVDLNSIVHMALLSMKMQYSGVDAEMDQDELPMLRMSRQLASTLFENLISNSFKYRAEERPLRLQCRYWLEGSLHWFSLRDNGSGISAKDLERVFTIFYRADESRGEGSGVGLNIVKKIVESYGGTINVESEAGEFTEFRFSLRATPGAED